MRFSFTYRHALVAVIGLSLFLNIYGIWWGLPNEPGAWAPDEINPLDVLDGIERRFSNGWWQVYPPAHYYLLTLVEYPAVLLDRMGLIDIRSEISYAVLYVLLRFVSVLMGTGTVLLAYACGRELFDRRSAVFAALITSTICPLVYYSKTANVDVPVLFWTQLSMFFFIRVLKDHRLGDYLGFSAAAALAIGTKDQAASYYVLTPVVIGWSAFVWHRRADSRASIWAALINLRTLGALGFGAVALALIYNVSFNWSGFVQHVDFVTSPANVFGPEQRFLHSLMGQLGNFAQGLRHLQFSMGWPLLMICTVGVVWALIQKPRNTRLLALLVPLASFWVFLLSVLLYHYDRWSMTEAVTLSLFGAPLLTHFTERGSRWRVARIGGVVAVFVFTFAYAFSVNAMMAADSRYAVERWMQEHISEDDLVLTVGFPMYLPRMHEYSSTGTMGPSVAHLQEVEPEYVITSSSYDERRWEEGHASWEFFALLKTGSLPYVTALSHQSRPKWNFLSFRGVLSNLEKIDPEINIYRRMPASAQP
ncbi:MAG: hypothetical protein CL477_12560 [Acidobacteria bacterium]|jgi:4-amino-4-deoxy-L-arabinose transferase-like glycosyltransferase|nr:hypothetical protein [Acidobacteriota bacterium]|tara:strand:- start:688 stop:2289 length:1602 start_codon:yes stop_codon:yes gene_type:complete